MPICETNGIHVHYVRHGRGTPIILLHGLVGSGACWAPVARRLDLDVVMPDARGHGRSSAPHEGYRYEDLASDVVGLIHALDLDRPVLLGHSMGGMTAAVAATRVSLRGLVLVDPTFLTAERQREVATSDVADQHRRLLARPREDVVAELRARHPHRSDEIVGHLADARLQTSLDAFAVLEPPNADHREVIRAIEVPILIAIGDQPVVTLEMATELRAINPRVRIEQIAAAGHGVPYDQPDQLAHVVATFVRDLEHDR